MEAEPKKPPTLSPLYVTPRDDRFFKNPTHLVHLEIGERLLFDVRSEAICQECGTRWGRVLNLVELVSG